MRRIYSFILLSLFLVSCNSEPSLQKYFVEHLEDKNFIAMDVSSSILNIDASKLTVEQSQAMQSFDKMNILAFKLNDTRQSKCDFERRKVPTINEIWFR